MPTAAVFGSTGAVGSQILSALLASNTHYASIKTISRTLPTPESAHLQSIQEPDTTKWSSIVPSLSPTPTTIFNAVGTTRAAAGGIENQWKIDHDLCIETARAAKEAGTRTYVFVSGAGTRGFLARGLPYSKMKIGVEDEIGALGFENAVILRPGLILGREKPKARLLEGFVEGLGRWVGLGVQDWIGQDQTVIGRAAVAAARLAEDGKAPSKYWVVEMADIVRLGRDEWEE